MKMAGQSRGSQQIFLREESCFPGQAYRAAWLLPVAPGAAGIRLNQAAH